MSGCPGRHQLVWDIFILSPSMALKHGNKFHVYILILGINPREASQMKASRRYACSTTFPHTPPSAIKVLDFTLDSGYSGGCSVCPKCLTTSHLL